MARRHGDDDPGPGRALREHWEELQFALIRGRYRNYRDILRDSLTDWATDRGYRWNERDGLALLHAMESWQPFPETVPALRRAKDAGLRLVIISNTDRSIMAHTLRQLELDFDAVVVAEDCEAYKPSPEPFELALERLGEPPGSVLHVAFGFRYDIRPAQRLGLRTAWVNRPRGPRPGSDVPDYEWDSLWGLAELVSDP